MAGGIGDIGSLLKQAHEVQKRLKEVQAQLEQRTVDGAAGGGMVRVTMNGKGVIVKVAIEPEVVIPAEKQMLEDLIVAAAAQAHRSLQEMLQTEMARATGGIKIPGLV